MILPHSGLLLLLQLKLLEPDMCWRSALSERSNAAEKDGQAVYIIYKYIYSKNY